MSDEVKEGINSSDSSGEEKSKALPIETTTGKTAVSDAENKTNIEEKAHKGKKQKDFRRVKTLPPMSVIVPFIMKDRIGSSNLYRTR